MKQRDRLYNKYMFEVENNQISLAPLYDYGNGFNFADSDYLYYDCLMGFEYQYFNELVPINVYVFDFLVQQYPQLKEYLNSLTKVDLLGLIKDICNRYNLVLTNELEQIYKEEENDSKIRIKSLL